MLFPLFRLYKVITAMQLQWNRLFVCAPLCNIVRQYWYFAWQLAPSKLRAQFSTCCLVVFVCCGGSKSGMKPWTYFFISIARRPEGNYFFPLWNRGNVACHRSQLTIFQYEKPFAQAANWNLNRNLLGANCQSKYQHCVTILQSGAQTNNRFHCNLKRQQIIHHHQSGIWSCK